MCTSGDVCVRINESCGCAALDNRGGDIKPVVERILDVDRDLDRVAGSGESYFLGCRCYETRVRPEDSILLKVIPCRLWIVGDARIAFVRAVCAEGDSR